MKASTRKEKHNATCKKHYNIVKFKTSDNYVHQYYHFNTHKKYL